METHRPKLVLIVDDDPCIREAVSRLLKREDIGSVAAGSLREAIRHLAHNRGAIGLAICDLSLGHDDGMTLVRHLRRRHPDILAVVLTAFGDWGTYAEAVGEHALDYLNKPVAPAELMAVVRRALGLPEPDAEDMRPARKETLVPGPPGNGEERAMDLTRIVTEGSEMRSHRAGQAEPAACPAGGWLTLAAVLMIQALVAGALVVLAVALTRPAA